MSTDTSNTTNASDTAFTVKLHRSGQRIEVQPGQTILAALQAAGLDPLHSCMQGICGTCLVDVIAGTPDHRDFVLGDDEKAQNTQMAICCSRSLSSELEIDL